MKPVQVIQTTLARNILFVNERLVAGQIQQLNSDYNFVIKIYDILKKVLENNSNQSEIMKSDLVASFQRCDNKFDDWISFVSEHEHQVNNFEKVCSRRSEKIYDLVQIDTARIFGDPTDKEAVLEEYIKRYEHDLRDACRLKRFNLFKMLVDEYLNESTETSTTFC